MSQNYLSGFDTRYLVCYNLLKFLLMENNMLDLMFSDLQARLKGKVSMEKLFTFLSNTGVLCSTTLQCGIQVLKFVNYAGKVFYSYGKSLRNALISMSHSVWC